MRVIVITSSTWWPVLLILIPKLYYSIRWLYQGQTRKALNPLYYTKMTFYFTCQFELLSFAISQNRWLKTEYGRWGALCIILGQVSYIFFLIVCLQIYMNYLDSIQFAKNNLLRDRQIIQRYLYEKENPISHKLLADSPTVLDKSYQ